MTMALTCKQFYIDMDVKNLNLNVINLEKIESPMSKIR